MKLVKTEIPENYKEDVEIIVKILKLSGVKEIFIFGSLVKGNFTDKSDIDIAFKGEVDNYFGIIGKIMQSIKHNFDLVELDGNNKFSNFIENNEELMKID